MESTHAQKQNSSSDLDKILQDDGRISPTDIPDVIMYRKVGRLCPSGRLCPNRSMSLLFYLYIFSMCETWNSILIIVVDIKKE